MSEAVDYLAAAIVSGMRISDAKSELSSFVAIKESLKRFGVSLTDEMTEVAARRLEQLGFLRRMTDKYAGTYFIPIEGLNVLLKIGSLKAVGAEATFAKALEGGDRLFSRVFKNEEFWADIGLETSAFAQPVIQQAANIEVVPASDRIVTLSHNQQLDLETSSTELIDSLAKENSIDGDAGLKDRLLGQIRAARELIRAQSVRVYLLHETVMTILGSLIERYRDQAIGQAAKKLLDLLIEHIFGK